MIPRGGGWFALALAVALAAGACSGSPKAGPASPARSQSPVPASTTSSGTDWTTYHHDPARTGVATGVPPVGKLATVWKARLDGAVYGQPLVVGSTVVAATERNSVYGLDRATGRVLWQRRVATPVSLGDLRCGGIDPLGITGTPVYDPDSREVFVVAETTGFRHVLYGLSVTDGSVRMTRDIPAPDGDARDDQQRPGLTLVDDRIYVAFGGLLGDCGRYAGSVVSVPVSGQGTLGSWKVPTRREGGIWGTGGATLGPGGQLYVTVGNGEASSGPFDGSDSVTALTPGMARSAYFAPSTWADDNAADLDLGSMSPAVVGLDRVLSVGKRGVGYLLRAPELGGIGGQVAEGKVCAAFGGPSVDGTTVYVPCGSGGTAAVSTAGDRLRVLWRGPSAANGSPVVGGGAVWTVADSGTLFALDPANGSVRARIGVEPLPHFSSPTLSGNLVLLGTLRGVEAVSGA
jgi:outer membrane protein assembly factor BamB